MRQIFEICVNIVEMFIVYGFLTLYFDKKYSKIISIFGFIFAWFVAVLTVTIINKITILLQFWKFIIIII